MNHWNTTPVSSFLISALIASLLASTCMSCILVHTCTVFYIVVVCVIWHAQCTESNLAHPAASHSSVLLYHTVHAMFMSCSPTWYHLKKYETVYTTENSLDWEIEKAVPYQTSKHTCQLFVNHIKAKIRIIWMVPWPHNYSNLWWLPGAIWKFPRKYSSLKTLQSRPQPLTGKTPNYYIHVCGIHTLSGNWLHLFYGLLAVFPTKSWFLRW